MVCKICLEAAASDPDFSNWATAHGLGFDYYQAVFESGLEYWTDGDDDFANWRDLRYWDGRKIPLDARLDYLDARNILAAKVVRYWGAYRLDVPPESGTGRSLTCDCDL